MLERIKETLSNIPTLAIVAVVLLVILGGFWAWKRFSSSDKESEVEKGARAAVVYAQNIQSGLEREKLLAPEPEPVKAKAAPAESTNDEIENEDDFEPFEDDE